jgi:drug/metabolite transporter (DMT)-like permease
MPQANDAPALPYVRLLGAQVAIGAAAIFARFALLGTGPLAVSALRMLIAAIVMLFVVACIGPRSLLGWRRELAFGVAGLLLALHFATWLSLLLYTSIAVAVLLVTTAPLWNAIYELAIARRAPSRSQLIAFSLAASGMASIALQRSTPAPIPGHALAGALLALAGALAISAYFIIVSAAGAAPREHAPLPTAAIVARTYTWAALALLVGAVLAHQGPPPLGDLRAWGGIAAMAFVSQLIGHTAMNASLRNFAPSIVAMTTLLEPPLAALLAVFIFGEALSSQTVIGGLAVLAGVAVTLRSTASAERMPNA